MKKLITIATLVALTLMAGAMMACGADVAAPAATAADATSDIFTKYVQPIVASVLGVLVSVAAAYLVQFLRTKTGIAISVDAQNQMSSMATNAVMLVEERAAAAAKQKLAGWTGQYKAMQAVEQLTKDLPGLTMKEADDLVHTALAKIPGLGATGVLGLPVAPAATDQAQAAT